MDSSAIGSATALERISEKIARSSIELVQLRFPEFFFSENFHIISKTVKFLSKHDKCVIINDRPEFAYSLGADGVHLGLSDISSRVARDLLGPDFIIGKTVRSVTDSFKALEDGSDYVAAGPCFSTPLKKDLRPMDHKVLQKIQETSRLPVYAIGGINADNVSSLLRLGVRRVVSSSYLLTDDVVGKADLLRHKLN